jgi:dephospho-CoA kinase
MRRIGLTGGIGSGKSTVAAILADLGARVIDADAIAREVVAPGTDGLDALVDAFGPGILTSEDSLDRAALAEIVFSNPEARETLNGITHPRIAARTAELIAQLPDDAILVHDVPLLAELQMQDAYDVVVVVDAPDEIRVQRLIERGLAEQDARARIAAQAPRQLRLAVADVVFDNTGNLSDLIQQVHSAWPKVSGQP